MGCTTSTPIEYDETMFHEISSSNIMDERILAENDGFCGDRNIIRWTPCDNNSSIIESANPASNSIITDNNIATVETVKIPTAIVLISHGLFEHGIRYTSGNLFLFYNNMLL